MPMSPSDFERWFSTNRRSVSASVGTRGNAILSVNAVLKLHPELSRQQAGEAVARSYAAFDAAHGVKAGGSIGPPPGTVQAAAAGNVPTRTLAGPKGLAGGWNVYELQIIIRDDITGEERRPYYVYRTREDITDEQARRRALAQWKRLYFPDGVPDDTGLDAELINIWKE